MWCASTTQHPFPLFAQQPGPPPNTYNPAVFGLGPIRPNQYGPGLNSDATGQPFEWRTQDAPHEKVYGPVQPDGYGMGVGMDQYGRPVKAKK